ncbi:MAG: FG-GAP-like repeat-containing protein [Planctomycetaceae bacterium]
MPAKRSSLQADSRRRFGVVAVIALSIIAAVWFRMRPLDTDALVARAYDAVRAGDFDEARRTLEELHEYDPANADVVDLLVETCLNAGDEPAAIEWLQKVPDSVSERAVAAAFRGAQLSMQSHRAASARLCLDRCLQLDPDNAAARRLLMHLELILTRWEALAAQIVELDRRGQTGPADVALLCVGRNYYWEDDSHLEWLEACVDQSPDDCLARTALAYYYASRSRREDSMSRLRDLNAAPDSFEGWRVPLGVAENHISQGEFSNAREELSRLPPEADSSLRVWLASARVFSEQGDSNAAIVAFNNASRIAPFDPEPVSELSRLLARRKEHKEASHWAHRAKLNSQLWQILSHAKPLAPQGPSANTVMDMGRLLKDLNRNREAQICFESLREHPEFGSEARRLSEVTRQGSGQQRYLSVAGLNDLDRSVSLAGTHSDSASSDVTATTREDESSQASVELSDIAADVGLNFTFFRGDSGVDFLPETLGGGIGVIDFDLDCWPDIFLTQGTSLPVTVSDVLDEQYSNRLFRNIGAASAMDVTAAAGLIHGGYGQGCAVADMDSDGFPDLFVCNHGENILYRNNGDGTFRDVTREAGIQGQQWSTSASFADFDGDGDPDLYSVNYVRIPEHDMKSCRTGNYVGPCRVMDFDAEPDIVWRNSGDGSFQDCTESSGASAAIGKGLGIVSADFDNDGWIDLFVGNDTTANFLFRNRGGDANTGSDGVDGSTWPGFEEMGVLAGVAFNRDGKSEACMGIACEDLNDDGLLDLFISNYELETNTFYSNLGNMGMVDQTVHLGMAEASRPMLGWGAQFVDLDADRDLDLFVANGHLYEPPMRSQLFLNHGGRFTEISNRAGAFFQTPRFGRSAAIIDWNRDLAADLVVSFLKSPVALLANSTPAGNRICVRLIGTESARDVQGLCISATVGTQVMHFRNGTDGGYFAANEGDVKIGLGSQTRIDTLQVKWPSGRIQTWNQLAAGKKYVLVENRQSPVVLDTAVRDDSR